MKQHFPVVLTFLLSLVACQSDKIDVVISHAEASDFDEAKQVSPTLAEGFELSLWAPGPLLSNAVALTFDQEGAAYVAVTSRRKSSDLDIRAHRDWMIDELSLQTIEDTRAFHLEKLATELSDQNTWQEDFNQDGLHDYRDLEVQTEYIRKVWDSDGDGRADISHVFAEGFNDMLTGVAAGILHYGDEVFLTAAPDVWRLQDTDKDGVADKRAKISHGYGIHIAYAGHDMSGLTVGPDGRIYWSIGDIGVNVVDQKGKRWAFPNQGAVMRANPDGSDFEVFAHGVRNPQELAFDNYGNLLSVDNDGDHPGEHERYIHIVEGSDTGWRINWQFGKYNMPNESYKVWTDELLHVPHFPGQAAYITPPLALAYDGPAGLAFNPGTALNEEWNDHFFVSYFTGSSARSKVQAFTIKPKGASFEIDTIKDIVGGIVPTGITFAPDGALYINDWKDSYDKKPEGRIWKLDLAESKKNPIRKATQQILKEGCKGKTIEELTAFMAHPDQRVRMAAQFELVNRNEGENLLQVAKENADILARLHAIWGLGQLCRKDKENAEVLLPLLKDKEAQVRAQTAKVMGEAKCQGALSDLLLQLEDASPRARFFAAEALGKLGDASAFEPLVQLMGQVKDTDPHMRHALIYALSRLNQAEALAKLSDHASLHVRIGAVVALRHLRSPLLAEFLKDTDPLVLAEAARAINDDFSVPDALPALAKALERTDIQNEAFLRRAINANLRLGDPSSALRLSNYAQSDEAPDSMRQDALWALGYWSKPMVLDRVDGRYRKLEGHSLSDAQTALKKVFTPLVTKKNPRLQAAAITAAGRLQYQVGEPTIFEIFKNRSNEVELRKAALIALSQLESKQLTAALDLALLDKDIRLRQVAQGLLAKIDLPASELVSKFEKILDNNTVPEQQKALASLAGVDAPETKIVLKKWMDRLLEKKLDPSLQLDVLMAIENSSFEDLKAQKAEYEKSLDASDPLIKYEAALYGGDVDRGLEIFSRNQSAQCLRCHVIKGYGGAVGPELTHIASKLGRKDLLLAMVAPNVRIAPGYGTILLTLTDGQELAGTLQEETEETISIQVGNDPIQVFSKSVIKKQETMPSGMFDMSTVLDTGQIRDVVAYLMTLE